MMSLRLLAANRGAINGKEAGDAGDQVNCALVRAAPVMMRWATRRGDRESCGRAPVRCPDGLRGCGRESLPAAEFAERIAVVPSAVPRANRSEIQDEVEEVGFGSGSRLGPLRRRSQCRAARPEARHCASDRTESCRKPGALRRAHPARHDSDIQRRSASRAISGHRDALEAVPETFRAAIVADNLIQLQRVLLLTDTKGGLTRGNPPLLYTRRNDRPGGFRAFQVYWEHL